MTRNRPRLSRRDALRAVGVGGGLSVFGATDTATSTADAADTGPADGWSKRATDRVDSSCSRSTMHSAHSLSYLNVAWEPYGAPNVGGAGAQDCWTDADGSSVGGVGTRGCWRHTFALTGVGAAEYDTGGVLGFPYGAMSLNVPTVRDDEEHPAEQQADAPPEPTATAVAARSHPGTFGFAERQAFERHLSREGIAPSDLSTASVSDADFHGTMLDTRAALAGASDVDYSVALSAASVALGAASPDDFPELGRFQRVASNTNILLSLFDVIAKYLDTLPVQPGPRVDRGVAATFPDGVYTDTNEIVSDRVTPGSSGGAPNYERVDCASGGAYFGAGCHYLVFDVFEVPGTDHVSAVDVVSAFDRHDEGRTSVAPSAGWSIVLDTPAPDDGDPSSDNFSAVAERSDAVTRRDPTEQVSN